MSDASDTSGTHASEFEDAPRDDSTFPDPIPGEGDPVATGTKGSGEWPSKDAPARGAAPGTVEGVSEAKEMEREEGVGEVVDVESVYGDDRAAVATMPEDERDRLLGRDADRDAGSDAGTDR